MLCGTVYYYLSLIIQETTLHVMWYSLLLTHLIIQKQHSMLCGTV